MEENNKMPKAIIVKNNDGTYRITDLDGNDYVIRYKIGNQEYSNTLMKNMELMHLVDAKKQFGIEFVNWDEIFGEKENIIK